KSFGISGRLHRFRREDARSLMMSMPIARRALPSGCDHVRTKFTDHAHHVSQGDVTTPFLQCLFRGLGVAKVGNAGESLLYTEVAVARQQLKSPQHPELVKKIAAGLVL